MEDSIRADDVEFQRPGLLPLPASKTVIVQPADELTQDIEVEALAVEVATALVVKVPKAVLVILVLQLIVVVILAVTVTEVAFAEYGVKI